MRIFKTTWFGRFADKEDISDDSLKGVISQLETGQFDADLGGGVYKQRLALPGSGKSGGYRLLLCFRQGERAFFLYGFSKSGRSNITAGEKADMKKLAKTFFALTDADLDRLVQCGSLQEICGADI